MWTPWLLPWDVLVRKVSSRWQGVPHWMGKNELSIVAANVIELKQVSSWCAVVSVLWLWRVILLIRAPGKWVTLDLRCEHRRVIHVFGNSDKWRNVIFPQLKKLQVRLCVCQPYTPYGLRTNGYLLICYENRIVDEFTSVQIQPIYWKPVSNHQNKMNLSSVVN